MSVSLPSPERAAASASLMVDRTRCIACDSPRLEELSSGRYREDPLRGFIAADPWGESPLPSLQDETWKFVRCRDCEQMFHERILSPAGQERLYRDWVTDEAMREFEAHHGISTPAARWEVGRNCVRHALRLEKLTRSLRGDRALRVLDFGCGWGQFLAGIALFGAEAYGVDRDADRLRQAAAPGVTLAPSLDELPPALRGQLDAISLFQVLEHLEEPRQLLEALHGWVQPGGILILETPDCTGVRGLQSQDDYRAINPLAHINAFTPETLTAIARRAGYARIDYVAAHATVDLLAVGKATLKELLPRLERRLRPSTDLYFRRV